MTNKGSEFSKLGQNWLLEAGSSIWQELDRKSGRFESEVRVGAPMWDHYGCKDVGPLWVQDCMMVCGLGSVSLERLSLA